MKYIPLYITMAFLMGCSDVQVKLSREYVQEPELITAIREKRDLEQIHAIILEQPTMIQETEKSHKIGPLALALIDKNKPLVQLLIESGANPDTAVHSLSNSYPHSFRQYLDLLGPPYNESEHKSEPYFRKFN